MPFEGDVEEMIEEIRNELPNFALDKSDEDLTPVMDFYPSNPDIYDLSGMLLNDGTYLVCYEDPYAGLYFMICPDESTLVAKIDDEATKDEFFNGRQIHSIDLD